MHQICRSWLPGEQLKLLHGLSHKHLQAIYDCATSLLGCLHEVMQALVRFLPLHCSLSCSRNTAFMLAASSSTCCKQSTVKQLATTASHLEQLSLHGHVDCIKDDLETA